jgi:hypothetical protein
MANSIEDALKLASVKDKQTIKAAKSQLTPPIMMSPTPAKERSDQTK